MNFIINYIKENVSNIFYTELFKLTSGSYIYIDKDIILSIIEWVNKFMSNIFVRNISLIEMMILIDGLINAMSFLQEYIVYNISKKRVTSDINKLNYKKDILKKCYNLYVVRTFDRYILYLFLYSCYLIFTIFTYNIDILGNYVSKYLLIESEFNISYIGNRIYLR